MVETADLTSGPTVRAGYEATLKEALSKPCGLAVICKDAASADLLKRGLFLVRKELREEGETSYDELNIIVSPHARNIIYLTKVT